MQTAPFTRICIDIIIRINHYCFQQKVFLKKSIFFAFCYSYIFPKSFIKIQSNNASKPLNFHNIIYSIIPTFTFYIFPNLNHQIYNISIISYHMQKATESQILQQYLQQRQQQMNLQIANKKAYIKQHIYMRYIDNQEYLEMFAEFFMDYIHKKKGVSSEEPDLELVSHQELQELVGTFIDRYPLPLGSEQEGAKQGGMSMRENTDSFRIEGDKKFQNEGFDAKKVYYSNGSWDYQLIGYEECKKIQRYFPENDYKSNIVIFQKHHIRKTGGFFGLGCKQQLWIEVKSNLLKQGIYRKVQDFIFLKNALTTLHPHVFICPLEISERDLGKITDQNVKNVVISDCRRFINFVVKHNIFLQNLHTHRFFKELNYEFYVANQKKALQKPILKAIENLQGCLQLQISDKNEATKLEYFKKSEQIEKVWQFIEQSNNRISEKLKNVVDQIEKQKKQVQRLINSFINKNFENIIEVMVNYNEIFKFYQENITDYQILYESMNLQLVAQSKKIWKNFTHYARQIIEQSREYSTRRKVFLQKQAKRLQQLQKKQQTTEAQQKIDPGNKTIISKLGISTNSFKQTAWIQRYSKWQGYINKQFVQSFQRLLNADSEILQKILIESLQKRKTRIDLELEFVQRLQSKKKIQA